MTARERAPDDAAAALGRLLHSGGEPAPAREANSELEGLLRAVRENPPAPARRVGRFIALAAAVLTLVAVVAGFEWHRRTDAGLTFTADGVPGREHVAIAGGVRSVDLAFSDGSVFDVEPAARLRVESSSAMGARLTLVEGKTLAHVVHRAQSHWSVEAGPFEVRVTGTRFGASWDAQRERLSVELYEGSVQVEGGGLVAPLAVHAGQRLEAGKGAGNWMLTSLEGPVGALSTARAPEPEAAPVAVSAAPATVPAPATSRPTTSRDWPALLARADFAEVVEQAGAMGVERCFATCSPGDLRVLADSARYLGRHELAEGSLLALRQRSPGDAASAAFLLGRLEESRDPQKALSWYERSLSEAPSGAYAAEATAGKMRLLLRSGGPTAAAAAAEQYVTRFPGGVHAAQAREVLVQVRARSDHR